MKLYAISYAHRGGRAAKKGSNDVLIVELYAGNKMHGMVTLNEYNNEMVYSKLEGNNFVPVYRDKLKGTT